MRFVALLVATGCLAACMGSSTCDPDAGTCQCTPGDNRSCNTEAGVAGLEVCSMQGQWGDCAPFMDSGFSSDNQVPHDVVVFDVGGQPQ